MSANGRTNGGFDRRKEERERQFYTNKKNFYALVFVVYFFWALAVPLTKLGYTGFGIETDDIFQMFTYAGVRLFFAGFLALVFCVVKKISIIPASAGELWQIAKLGMLMSVLQYVFLYIGTAFSQGVVVSILTSTGAFFGILFSSFVFKDDKMTVRKAAGCILGVIAVVILNIHDVKSGIVFSAAGGLLVLAAEAAGTLGAVYLKYVSQGRNAIYVGGMQSFIGGGFLIVSGIAGGGSLHELEGYSAAAGWSTVILVFSSGLTLILSNQLYKYNDISKVVIFTLLLPVFGTVASALLLGESLASLPLLASLLINCIGVALVTIDGGTRKSDVL